MYFYPCERESDIRIFYAKRLRQGDPIAHFLFLIVVEGLGGLVREATRRNLFSGYNVGNDGVSNSHI